MRSAATIALVVAAAGLSTSQTIDPSTVPIADRNQWCLAQRTQCPLICLQTPANSATTVSNTCDPDTLSYSCVCANNLSPNVTQYSQTIPYFECTEYNNQCVNNCTQGDNACAAACRNNNLCGAQAPTRVNSSTIATMSATSTGADATGTADYTGFGDGAAATTTGSHAGSGAGSVFVDGSRWGSVVGLVGVFAAGMMVLL